MKTTLDLSTPTSKPPPVASGQLLFRVVTCKFPPHNVYKYQAAKTTSLGPVMVATVARARCVDKDGPWLEAEVIDENNYRRRHRPPRDDAGNPDHRALQTERYAAFVGLSCGMTTSAPRCLDLIEAYRNLPDELRPKAIIVGGWHAMDNPAPFLKAGADIIVHGEAELVLGDLLTALRDGTLDAKRLAAIPGISYRVGDVFHYNTSPGLEVPQEMMDRLPEPDFGLVRYATVNIFPVGRTRGCNGRCRFCRVNSGARWLSPQRFLEHIVVLTSKGARKFFVIDDRSEQDLAGFKEWLTGLAEFRRQRKVHLDLTTQNRLSLAEHPDVLALMRDAGVRTVAIGFESPMPEELRAMRKPVQPSKMLEWNAVWKRHGFFVHMMLIFGYPLSPEARQRLAEVGKPDGISLRKRVKAFSRFIRRAKPDTLQVLLYTPLPGTEDRKFLVDEDRIYPMGWEYYDGTWLTFQPDGNCDPVALQAESIKLMRRFYDFRWTWRVRPVALVVHLAHIAAVTVSLPLLWPFIGWRRWRRMWRDSKLHFQAHLVIGAWLRNFRRIDFSEQLRQAQATA